MFMFNYLIESNPRCYTNVTVGIYAKFCVTNLSKYVNYFSNNKKLLIALINGTANVLSCAMFQFSLILRHFSSSILWMIITDCVVKLVLQIEIISGVNSLKLLISNNRNAT